MKTLVLALAAVAAMSATAASAAGPSSSEFFNYTDGSGTFGGTENKGAGSFTDIFTFTTTSGEVDGSVTLSSYLSATSATFDGQTITLLPTSTGSVTGTFDTTVTPGTQTLDIMGTSSKGHAGSFGGQVEFTSSAPEPYTWALMIAGVAMAGSALRLSRKKAEGLLAV